MQDFTSEQFKDYFSGKCPKQQEEEIKAWLEDANSSAELDEAMTGWWKRLPNENKPDRWRRAFQKFCRRTGIKEKAGRGFWTWTQRVAAILILPLAVGLGYFYHQSEQPKDWVEEYVPYGQTREVVLPDQTKVWLNAGSRLVYPSRFNHRLRQIFVTGEAYLEVAKDVARPFYLSAGNISIRVLGTKFNVRSYIEDRKTEVSLVEGSIALTTHFNGQSKSFHMVPGNVIALDNITGEVDAYRFSVNNYTSWSDPNCGLYFHNQTLQEIADHLKRKFNVEIVIRDESLKEETYFASFVNKESVNEILSALNVNGGMRIERRGNIIDVYCAQGR